ncbi:hypothetical protein AKJ16_DCAP06302 [Drosera capensis]
MMLGGRLPKMWLLLISKSTKLLGITTLEKSNENEFLLKLTYVNPVFSLPNRNVASPVKLFSVNSMNVKFTVPTDWGIGPENLLRAKCRPKGFGKFEELNVAGMLPPADGGGYLEVGITFKGDEGGNTAVGVTGYSPTCTAICSQVPRGSQRGWIAHGFLYFEEDLLILPIAKLRIGGIEVLSDDFIGQPRN